MSGMGRATNIAAGIFAGGIFVEGCGGTQIAVETDFLYMSFGSGLYWCTNHSRDG